MDAIRYSDRGRKSTKSNRFVLRAVARHPRTTTPQADRTDRQYGASVKRCTAGRIRVWCDELEPAFYRLTRLQSRSFVVPARLRQRHSLPPGEKDVNNFHSNVSGDTLELILYGC